MTSLIKSILIILSLRPTDPDVVIGDCTMLRLEQLYRGDTTFYIAENAIKFYKVNNDFYLSTGQKALSFTHLDQEYAGGNYYHIISWYRRGTDEYLYVYPKLENDSPIYTSEAGRLVRVTNGRATNTTNPHDFHDPMDMCIQLSQHKF